MKITSPTSRSLIVFVLPLLLAAACARHYQPTSTERHSTPAAQAAPVGQSSAAPAADASSPRPQVRIEGELLAFPDDALSATIINDRIKGASSVSDETLQAFMKIPEARLLLRPHVMIADGEDGVFILSDSTSTEKPRFHGIKMSCHPTLLSDGKVHMRTRLDYSLNFGTHTLEDERDVQPDPRRNILIGPRVSGGQRIYFFLKLTEIVK